MRWPSKKTSFWILIGLSAVSAFVVPARWVPGIPRFFQALPLAGWPFARLAHWGQAVQPASANPELAGRIQALEEENGELRRQVGQGQMRLAEAGRRIAELTGIEDQLSDSHVEVVIAPVLGYDTSPRQPALRVFLGERAGKLVTAGQWVMAGARQSTDVDARAAMDRQYLIGRVAQVLPHVATVQLVTDRAFPPTTVQLAQQTAEGWELADEKCLLRGTGTAMRIDLATANYSEQGYRVVLVVDDPELPHPLTIGHVTGATARTDSPQHFDLQAEPWGALDRLNYVYILCFQRGSDAE